MKFLRPFWNWHFSGNQHGQKTNRCHSNLEWKSNGFGRLRCIQRHPRRITKSCHWLSRWMVRSMQDVRQVFDTQSPILAPKAPILNELILNGLILNRSKVHLSRKKLQLMKMLICWRLMLTNSMKLQCITKSVLCQLSFLLKTEKKLIVLLDSDKVLIWLTLSIKINKQFNSKIRRFVVLSAKGWHVL